MNVQCLQFLMPYIKTNVLDNYLIVDTIILPTGIEQFKAYVRNTNNIVKINKLSLLPIPINLNRFVCLIKAISTNMIKHTEILIEDHTSSNYLNVYIIQSIQ